MRYIIYILLFHVSDMSLGLDKAKGADTLSIYNIFISAQQLQNTNPDSSFVLAKQGLSLSKEINYERGIGMAFMRMGGILNIKGSTESAIQYTKEALNIRIKIKDLIAAASTSSQLSYIYNTIGKKDSAFYYLYQAIHYSETAQDSGGIANSYTELGRLFSEYSENEKALKYLQQALDILLRLDNLDDITAGYSNLGDFYFKENDFHRALAYYNSAYSNAKLSGNITNIANSNINIALCYNNLKQYKQAKSHYRAALEFYIQQDFKSDIALVYYNLGVLYEHTNLYDSSLVCLNTSLSISRTINNSTQVANCLKDISFVYSQIGDYKQAFVYQLQYAALKDSLHNNEKVKQIAEMQTKYETEKKEQQIAFLDEQNIAKAYQRNFFIICFILVLLLVGVIINRYRLKQKSNTALSKTLQELKDTQKQLLQSEKMATFGAVATRVAHEILNPLNFVNNFSQFSEGLIDDLKEAKTDEEKEEIYNNLKSNLQKIMHHGKRAGAIVKELIEHTRAGTAHEYFEEDTTNP